MTTVIRRSRLFLPVLAAVLLFAVFASVHAARAANTFVVDNVTDDPLLCACTGVADDCSLRGAVIAANAAPGVDTIEFLIPSAQCPGGVCPIAIANGSIEIAETVTIDATTQPLHNGTQANVCATASAPSHPRVEIISNPAMPGTSRVFLITDPVGPSTVRGFALGDDAGGSLSSQITLIAGTGHHIACNHIALTASGQAQLGTADSFTGILVEGTVSGVVIGTNGDGVDDIGERNVFASGGYSVYNNGNDDVVIAGNYFGFSADGLTHVDAGSLHIRQGASNNIVGTNEDGLSDELERNYFGNNGGTASVGLAPFGTGLPTDVGIVGNTFGVSPDGTVVSVSRAVEVYDLSTIETGFEIRDNTFAGANNAISIIGDEAGASALIADNVFGVGAAASNGDAIWLHGLGSHVVRDNLIANSTGSGLVLADTAGLAAGSVNNCVVGNNEGVDNATGFEVNLENNWWGSIDGPSGIGSGSGDSIKVDADFTPWLTN
ncbi:MAG: hypothetical protein QNL12_11560, partial [Acidimicrobiia bacterium]|nr:hypothetical protein [Acidimicrobiia bacterium]